MKFLLKRRKDDKQVHHGTNNTAVAPSSGPTISNAQPNAIQHRENNVASNVESVVTNDDSEHRTMSSGDSQSASTAVSATAPATTGTSTRFRRGSPDNLTVRSSRSSRRDTSGLGGAGSSEADRLHVPASAGSTYDNAMNIANHSTAPHSIAASDNTLANVSDSNTVLSKALTRNVAGSSVVLPKHHHTDGLGMAWSNAGTSDHSEEDIKIWTDLPSLRDAAPDQVQELLVKKLMLCAQHIYDFTQPESCLAGKEAKKNALVEIVEFINCGYSGSGSGQGQPQHSGAGQQGPTGQTTGLGPTQLVPGQQEGPQPLLSEPAIAALVNMVSANIFRPLRTNHMIMLGQLQRQQQIQQAQQEPASHTLITSVSAPPAVYDPDDDEPTFEPAWPHLQIVYEIFLRFVVLTEVDAKTAKRYIDQAFVLKLLDLFPSDDPRERDYLKTILHRIYGKIMALRSFTRRAIQNLFLRFLYEQQPEVSHKGISELLEILGSIINGFALPLKDEHRTYLERSLIPLHKARSLCAFHQQLTYCMAQYVDKDPRLAEPVIKGLLRFWPVTNTSKEVIFLNELEEVLELIQAPELQKVIEPLGHRLALSIQSPHFQVAERVLFLWNNDVVVQLFNSHKDQLFPIIIGALYNNSREHWNTTVHGLTYNVSKLLAEADPKLFDDCSDRNLAMEEQKKKAEEEARTKWAELEAKFESKRNRSLDYTASH